MCWDEELGFEEPYSRESEGYFKTEAEAQTAMTGGFILRDCIENNHGYEVGDLPKPPTRKPADA